MGESTPKCPRPPTRSWPPCRPALSPRSSARIDCEAGTHQRCRILIVRRVGDRGHVGRGGKHELRVIAVLRNTCDLFPAGTSLLRFRTLLAVSARGVKPGHPDPSTYLRPLDALADLLDHTCDLGAGYYRKLGEWEASLKLAQFAVAETAGVDSGQAVPVLAPPSRVPRRRSHPAAL